MSPVDDLNDDYVAALLLKDAKANKKSWQMNNISTSKRKPDAPKPNISFLRNVLRETDSHNAALKAKEEEESRIRLRNLKGNADGTRKRRRDEAADDDERDARSGKRRIQGERSGRWASALAGLGSDTKSQRRSKNGGSDAVHKGSAGSTRPDRGEDRERSGRYSEHENSRRKHRHRRDERQRHPRSPNRSSDRAKAVQRRSPSRSSSPNRDQGGSRQSEKHDSDSDSDPLDDFLGPRRPPTVLPRGRGAVRPSGIDSRFQPDYNPRTDVNLEQDYERDDWDMALEALRDRAKWKAQGSERLRAAGFTDEEVRKWEKSGNGEKDVADVRWKKKGESREWDRGKVIDGDGVRLKADW